MEWVTLKCDWQGIQLNKVINNRRGFVLFTELQYMWEKLAEGAMLDSSCLVEIATKAAVVQINDEIEIL